MLTLQHSSLGEMGDSPTLLGTSTSFRPLAFGGPGFGMLSCAALTERGEIGCPSPGNLGQYELSWRPNGLAGAYDSTLVLVLH